MMIKHFIFDWSGTLADDLPPVLDATNQLLRNHGKPEFSRDGFCDAFQLPFKGFYDRVLPGVSLDDLEVEFGDYFSNSNEPITLLSYAAEFLDFCKRRGGKIFILSSARDEFLRKQATDLGVIDRFDHIYASVLDKREMIWKILESHGLNADETAFLGDMVHDVETAQHAGVHSIALLTGYDSIKKLSAVNPDLIASDLRQLSRMMAMPDDGDTGRAVITAGAIHVERLEIPCHIGVPDAERASEQLLWVDIDAHPSLASFSGDDVIDATVDYHALCEAVRELAASRPRQLVETLAREIVECILAEFAVRRVDVRVRKNILDYTESVGVSLSGERSPKGVE